MSRSTHILPWMLTFAFGLFTLSTPVSAAVFCVGDAAGLQSALITAASNGQDDRIQIVQGTYVGNFFYIGTESSDLTVQGGWTPGCTSWVLDPASTVLDGNAKGSVINISPGTDSDVHVVLEGITIRNGYSVSGDKRGGGIYSHIGDRGSLTVASCIISQNVSVGVGGGVYVNNNLGAFRLINSLIQNNKANSNGGGLYVIAGGSSLFLGNTITSNRGVDGGGALIYVSDSSQVHRVANTIFTENTVASRGADLAVVTDLSNDLFPLDFSIISSNFDHTPDAGLYSDLPITIDPSNFDKVDPLFVDSDNGDFRLLPGSPMIDAGNPDTPYLPELDIVGTPRVLGSSVDIGAYEFDDASDPGGILFIRVEGTGSGTITSHPAGIDCGDDCANGFVLNTQVTLTATPDADSIFSGWSGDPDCAAGSLTMDGNNRSCTATFTAVNTLRVSKTGAGDGLVTSSPPGIACGQDCEAQFLAGSTVTLTANSNAGSELVGWSGGTCCRETCVVDVQSVQSVTAIFRLIGDINSDGVVNALDVQMVINQSLGISQ